MEITQKIHLRNGYCDSFKEKEYDLSREHLSFVKITNLT